MNEQKAVRNGAFKWIKQKAAVKQKKRNIQGNRKEILIEGMKKKKRNKKGNFE